MPVAASSVAANPDPYVGEYVTMTGAVEANLTKTSFSVDQDKTKSTGKEVLVLAPTLQKQADANGYVTVIGQLIKFDEKEVAAKLKDYKIDLSPADIAKFKGKPVVLATAGDQHRRHRHREEADPADERRRSGAAEDHDQAAGGTGRACASRSTARTPPAPRNRRRC